MFSQYQTIKKNLAMSFWGATVITNLLSAIPWIGQDAVELILSFSITLSFFPIIDPF